MQLLKNFDKFIEYYDMESKKYHFYDSLQKTVGSYKIIGNVINAILVQDYNLFFVYGEQKIEITNSHKVLINKKSNLENEFCLMDENDVLVRFLYSIPDSQLNVSPFEYLDEDDFNWGNFVEKIINDEEKKINFVKNLMEHH